MGFEEIRNYKPTPEDKFFVDANVWYWTTYVASRQMNIPNSPKEYQVEHYPDFIQRALDIGAKLFVTPFILAELASIIEHTEFEIYKQWNSTAEISKKRFRKDTKQRLVVVREIEAAWTQVTSLATCMDVLVDGSFVDSCLSQLKKTCLDGYDLFHLNAALLQGVSKLVTDDKDFRTVGEIKVFTTYGD